MTEVPDIDAWHDGPEDGVPLHAYLGLTWEQYRAWAERGGVPEAVKLAAAATCLCPRRIDGSRPVLHLRGCSADPFPLIPVPEPFVPWADPPQ